MPEGTDYVLIHDGDVFTFGSVTMSFREVPGHTAGCIACFFDGEENGVVKRFGYFGGFGFNTIAKDKRAKIAEERRLMVDRREEATKDAISSVRGEYMNFAGPVLPNGNPNPNYDASRYDPRKQKLWDLANKLYGKEALHTPAPKVDPSDPDPPSPEDRTFAWYFDPTKVDEDGNIKPAFAKKIMEEIATIKRNDPAEYKKFEKEYESIANEMAQIRAGVKNDTQRREGLAKYRDQIRAMQQALDTAR